MMMVKKNLASLVKSPDQKPQEFVNWVLNNTEIKLSSNLNPHGYEVNWHSLLGGLLKGSTPLFYFTGEEGDKGKGDCESKSLCTSRGRSKKSQDSHRDYYREMGTGNMRRGLKNLLQFWRSWLTLGVPLLGLPLLFQGQDPASPMKSNEVRYARFAL